MNFLNLQNSVLGHIGDYSSATRTKVKRWLNDGYNIVWEEVYGKYKQATDYLTTSASYTSSTNVTVAASNGSTTVSSDGSSSTAFTSAMVGRFMQIDGTDPWYKIATVVSATELTLADAYIGTTTTGASFEIHTYLHSLSSDVGRLRQVVVELTDREVELEIRGEQSVHVDLPSPLRWDSGTPSYCWLSEKDSSGNYQLGVYPVPDDATLIRYVYDKTITEMSADTDSSDIPGGDAAILAHALIQAYTMKNRNTAADRQVMRFEMALSRLYGTVGRSQAVFRRKDHSDAGHGVGRTFVLKKS